MQVQFWNIAKNEKLGKIDNKISLNNIRETLKELSINIPPLDTINNNINSARKILRTTSIHSIELKKGIPAGADTWPSSLCGPTRILPKTVGMGGGNMLCYHLRTFVLLCGI